MRWRPEGGGWGTNPASGGGVCALASGRRRLGHKPRERGRGACAGVRKAARHGGRRGCAGRPQPSRAEGPAPEPATSTGSNAQTQSQKTGMCIPAGIGCSNAQPQPRRTGMCIPAGYRRRPLHPTDRTVALYKSDRPCPHPPGQSRWAREPELGHKPHEQGRGVCAGVRKAEARRSRNPTSRGAVCAGVRVCATFVPARRPHGPTAYATAIDRALAGQARRTAAHARARVDLPETGRHASAAPIESEAATPWPRPVRSIRLVPGGGSKGKGSCRSDR